MLGTEHGGICTSSHCPHLVMKAGPSRCVPGDTRSALFPQALEGGNPIFSQPLIRIALSSSLPGLLFIVLQPEQKQRLLPRLLSPLSLKHGKAEGILCSCGQGM